MTKKRAGKQDTPKTKVELVVTAKPKIQATLDQLTEPRMYAVVQGKDIYISAAAKKGRDGKPIFYCLQCDYEAADKQTLGVHILDDHLLLHIWCDPELGTTLVTEGIGEERDPHVDGDDDGNPLTDTSAHTRLAALTVGASTTC